ncbi:MAG: hypothetical protein QOK32_868 [Gaiellaceae bacterium]|nr:hypothetical protein [Gaiellaceae bacterium]
MKAWLCLLLVALPALTGCGGSANADAPLSSRERVWVRQFALWAHTTQNAGDAGLGVLSSVLAGSGTRADYDRAVAPMRECRTRFEAKVGDAPTKRLEPAQKLALEGCASFQRWVRAESRALTGPPGDALLESQAALAEGNRLWLESDRMLEAVSPWNRPLPVRTGEVDASRVEPRFGRVGSALANRPVQVRCWSSKEWPRILGDWRAYTADEHEAIGFVASFDRGRLSLAPRICRQLAALTYGGSRPRGGAARLDLAEAVETLAHEVEHLVSPGTEADTECYGMQDMRRVAMLLGAERAYADGLAEVFWRDLYPRNSPAYRTARCRDGGPLDRNPSSPVWP